MFHKFLGTFLLLILCGGCAIRSDLDTRVASKAPLEEICRVAVLPFENRTSKTEAAVMAYRVFHGELIAAGALDLEPEGEVGLFMRRNRLRLGQLLTPDNYADLARRMEVDAVVKGKVVDVGMENVKGTGVVPFIALQVDMFDARSGALVLSTFHRRRGGDYQKLMHFGTVKTVTGLMAHLSREIINDWQKKGVGNCTQ